MFIRLSALISLAIIAATLPLAHLEDTDPVGSLTAVPKHHGPDGELFARTVREDCGCEDGNSVAGGDDSPANGLLLGVVAGNLTGGPVDATPAGGIVDNNPKAGLDPTGSPSTGPSSADGLLGGGLLGGGLPGGLGGVGSVLTSDGTDTTAGALGVPAVGGTLGGGQSGIPSTPTTILETRSTTVLFTQPTASSKPASTSSSGEMSASQCNTGPIQCCESMKSANDESIQGLLGKLNIAPDSIIGQVGLQCTPITGALTGSGATCSQEPVCCTNNNYNGFVNVGCSPVNLNL
ncbi:fungal hydrophobin-domain-containing protein [Hygrophoropsis aurantiaca]|uniref:Fungal hydrophobin-domain-containing protein n=1 Tax=Hygrophoropsis aurantiaca TaxID=72124 RepID=A0ACB8ATS8_9AGAM|nr:fungal hydrophobin-domain-containing protein [Hygrophoropsis aurantiaca]